MKKIGMMLMTLCALLAVCAMAAASGTTLRVYTPYADEGADTQAFADMLTAWEQKTGNIVEDYSDLIDMGWMERMCEAVRAGEADVLVLPVGSGLTFEDVLTVDELAAYAPQLGLRKFSSMAEKDGSVLLSPMNICWEALYVNRDMMESMGLRVPESFEELIGYCSVLAQKDVVPIANAMTDWPEIMLDCAAQASVPEDQFGGDQALEGAQGTMLALAAVGAFGRGNADDEQMQDRFLCGSAAMRADDYVFAEMIPEALWDSVVVVPFPRRVGDEGTGVIAGMPMFGVTLSRACAADDERREAAISLLAEMLTGENAAKLVTSAGGALGESIVKLCREATDCSGLLYDQLGDDEDGRYEAWVQNLTTMLSAF